MDLREWISRSRRQVERDPVNPEYDLGYQSALTDLSEFLDIQDDVIRRAEEKRTDALTNFYKGRE